MSLFQRFHYHRPHYFAKHLASGLQELYIMVGLNELALSAITIFEPIYLFGLGFELWQIALYYAVVYVVYLLLAPLGAIVASKFGFPKTILLSSVFMIGYYGSLFTIPFNPMMFWIAPLAFGLQKSLYWPSFEADFVRYSHLEQEGKEFSGIVSLATIVTIIGPILGGLLIKLYGFPALFATVMGLILLSNVPLFFSKNPPTHEPASFGSSWKFLWHPMNRRPLTAYMGYAEELVVLVFWPLAMFFVVQNVTGLGSVVALSTLITAMVTLYIGRLTDQRKEAKLINLGANGTSAIWLVRILAVSPLLVLLADIASRLFKSIFYIPLTELTYARAAKEGPLKIAVFYEQSLAIGKLLMALLLALIFSVTDQLWPAFIVAAASALLYRRLVNHAH